MNTMMLDPGGIKQWITHHGFPAVTHGPKLIPFGNLDHNIPA
jgi:hypothetical protein